MCEDVPEECKVDLIADVVGDAVAMLTAWLEDEPVKYVSKSGELL